MKRTRGHRIPRASMQITMGPRAGPGVESASIEEVLAALETTPSDLQWSFASERVVPMLDRVRPYPPSHPERLRRMVQPGISIGFGIDIGPAHLQVTPEMLGSWGIGVVELVDQALVNVARLASATGSQRVVSQSVDGVDVRALATGIGGASTLVLLPSALASVFGSEPSLFIAPMRDLLIALPADVDRGFASWLHAEFASADPNCLAPIAFVWGDGHVLAEPLGQAFAAV